MLTDDDGLEPTRLRAGRTERPETRMESPTQHPRSYLRLSYSDYDLRAPAIQTKPVLARVRSALVKKTVFIDGLPGGNGGLRRRGMSDAGSSLQNLAEVQLSKSLEPLNDLQNAQKAKIERVSQTPLVRQLYTRSHNFISRPLQQRSSPDVLNTSRPPAGGRRHRYRPSESFLSLSIGRHSLLHLSLPEDPPSPNETERMDMEFKKADRQEEKMKDRRPATASGALEGRSSKRNKTRSRVAKPSPETEGRREVVVRALFL